MIFLGLSHVCSHMLICIRCVWFFELPWSIACQAHLSLEFSRQGNWSGLTFSPPGDLSDPGIKPASSVSPALADRLFTTEPPGKPIHMHTYTHVYTWACCCYLVAKSCQLFVTPRTSACQASLSFTISRSLLKFMSTESVMLPKHLILCCPLLLLPSIFPSIRVFPNKSGLQIRWPEY